MHLPGSGKTVGNLLRIKTIMAAVISAYFF